MLAMLPLETLPGWPEVPDPGLAAVLVILVGIPLALAAPLFLLTVGPAWFRQTRATSLEASPAPASTQAEPANVLRP